MLPTASIAFLLFLGRWQVQAADSEQPYPRLPTDLSPIFYDWRVKIFLPADDDDRTIEESKKFTIEGEVKIQIQCHEETNVVVLHQKNLTIDRQSVSLMPENGDRFSLIDIIIENKTEMVFFEFDQKMKKNGKYTLRLNYTGPIHDDLEGIYNSSYIGGLKNTKRYLIATQMEPLAARRALPCFDEPRFKAVFRVTIIHPINTRALSNGMELREQPIDIHWQRTIFKDSPKMSSYLLAIAVFLEEYEDYGYMSADPMNVPASVKHIRFRAFARYKVLDQTRYALDVGPKIMAFFQRHLGMEYPLDKCDMIALPHFNFGAMENWGLITYRESALLYDPDVSKLTHKMGVAAIIAHELAHQVENSSLASISV